MGHGAVKSESNHYHIAPAVVQAHANNAVRDGKPPPLEGPPAGSAAAAALAAPAAAAAPGQPSGASAPAADPGGGGDEKPLTGLAARRKMIGLQQMTINKERSMQKGETPDQPDNKKSITVCERYADLYTLGKEVMPSTNTGMDVLFATRKKDKKEVVVKTREKATSFISKNEEQEWRRSTEMLLNLPESENIAQIYEVLEDSKMYYVVMEKVEGMDLFEAIHGDGRVPLGEVKAILRQLLQAVQDLHARGCIHKDLKLENVMVDRAPSPKGVPKSPASPKGKPWNSMSASIDEPCSPTVVKLIDFDTVETFSPKSKAKSVVGTDQYIAQEAYAGHYSPASDIFSVGVIAYRLVSGRFPFKHAMFDDKPGENWVGSPKMKIIQDRLKHFTIDFNITPWPAEPKARDLVRWMLQNNEKERPTAVQALEHNFFVFTGETPALPKGVWKKSL